MRTLLLLLPSLALGAPVPEVDAEKAAKAFVEKSKATNGELKALKSEALARVYPEYAFFTLRFRQWPVAFAPAEGFKPSNVLVIDDRGEALLLTSGMQLSKLSGKVKASDEKAALQVVHALLTLQAELLQDGFYKFEVVEESLRTEKIRDKLGAFGRSIVREGGNGEIVAAVTIDAGGRLYATSLADSVKQGVRPRCQATLLLHADPEVRAVCERNLLLLGVAAREYLQDQHRQATPALQVEIDRVWRKIEAGNR